MNWTSLGAKLASIGLPALGTILGGPLGGTIGGVVGRSIAEALGVEATPEAVSKRIDESPDLVRLRLATIEAESKADAEETKRLEARLADANSARQQTVSLAQAGSSIAWGAPVMSIAAISCFTAFTIALFFIHGDIPDKLFALLNMGYGANLVWVGQSFNYWLGSSEGSKRNADVVRATALASSTPTPTHVAEKAIDAVRGAGGRR